MESVTENSQKKFQLFTKKEPNGFDIQLPAENPDFLIRICLQYFERTPIVLQLSLLYCRKMDMYEYTLAKISSDKILHKIKYINADLCISFSVLFFL